MANSNNECLMAYTFSIIEMVKPGQNKKGQKIFQPNGFLNTFIQLAAEKKYSKNGAAGNHFVMDLVHS